MWNKQNEKATYVAPKVDLYYEFHQQKRLNVKQRIFQGHFSMKINLETYQSTHQFQGQI